MTSLIQPQQIRCCANPDWHPRVYACRKCGSKVESNFAAPEFSNLSADELHLLRIFVWAEGRIKDMEGPMGMSYPTIRVRLSELRSKLFGTEAEPEAQAQAPDTESAEPDATPPAAKPTREQILDALARKEITFEDAMKKLSHL